MNRFNRIPAVCLAVVAFSTLLWAGVDLQLNVNIGGPEIEFVETPAVVLASPGIYVVPNYPYEVFLVSGFYWSIHNGHWYRCAGPRGKWVKVEIGKVPHGLVKIPRGKYKNWHPGKGQEKVKVKVKKGHGKH